MISITKELTFTLEFAFALPPPPHTAEGREESTSSFTKPNYNFLNEIFLLPFYFAEYSFSVFLPLSPLVDI